MVKKNKIELICSFCGKSESESFRIIQGSDVAICDQCVFESVELLKSDIQLNDVKHEVKMHLPMEIKKELDKYVVGQEHAKIAISVAVYNHYKRISSRKIFEDVEIDKSNILLIGPTGTGKTLIAQTLARFLEVPFTIVDATILTEAGYVGEDVENILVRLLQSADYDLQKAEKGIIYIDEIDKIGRKTSSPSITRDVSGEGVQQALLKILEGTISSVPPKGGRKHPEQPLVNVNTKDILFICGGAFDGLEELIKGRIKSSLMGFGAEVRSPGEMKIGDILTKCEPVDLIKYGLIPELVGRLPVLSTLKELDEEALRKILLEPKNSLIKQYKKLFKLDGVDLIFEEGAIQKVVELAKERGTGARALRAILEEAMQDVMFKVPSMEAITECVIDERVITTKIAPVIKRRLKRA
ncbi:ATP-dependent Clp protease ATP-binding subunit ClpX [Candidatus Marinimicrobia bacterium MT.SAG.3]|nr:ATP-dependent Clp protease ATP-binding subunit ClpX [Candidatus Marinimicrobia bacterium MT.SAG.3]